MRYRIAAGPIAGRKTPRLQAAGAIGARVESAKPLTVIPDGFSLIASVACRTRERKKLERLCRYVARPPLALDRLSRDGDGLVVHELKRPFRDGATEFCCPWMGESRGGTMPGAACSSRSIFSRGWRPLCRAREVISFVITQSSAPTPATAAWSRRRLRP